MVAQVLGDRIAVRSGPDDADPARELANPTPGGSPLVFLVVEGSAAGTSDMIEVYLPVKPNGSTGWVRRVDVVLSDNPYRVEVDRAAYELRVYKRNVLWIETKVALGTGATPTPVGRFYVLELLEPTDPGGLYGPFAFGLSGFSEVLERYEDADEAIIGIHGTNEPEALGSDVSHGCVRIDNKVIKELADKLPLGTPVVIT